jgi:hypothetical protein
VINYTGQRFESMKTNPLLVLGTAFLLTVVAAPARAQTWETILQLDSGLGGASSGGGANRALMLDPASATASFPRLVVTGKTLDNGVNDIPERVHRLQQPEDPSGSGLVPLDANAGTIFSLTADANGALYSAGSYSVNSTTTGWIVRRSTDNGATWTTIRTLSLGGTIARARGITVTSAGGLVVCGTAFDAAGFSHWIVETSADNGTSWLNRDVFKSPVQSSLGNAFTLVEARGAAELSGPGGGLFVVGVRLVAVKGSQWRNAWTVTRSSDGGQSWEIVDPSPYNSWGASDARKVAVDASGRIFVMGDTGSLNEQNATTWVVRMSTGGGAPGTWTTIFGPWQDGISSAPWDMTIDAFNNVWIAGQVFRRYPTGKGKNSYAYTTTATVVRLQESTPGIWSPTFYALTPEYNDVNSAQASSITADQWGRVYVNGTFQESSTSPIQWFVKRWAP